MKGDERHIQQALSSLMTNAAEAIGDGEGLVRVNVFPVVVDAALLAALVPGSALAEGPAACVEIQDDGPGLDPEMVGKVFDPFFTTRRRAGVSAFPPLWGSCGSTAAESPWRAGRERALGSGSSSPPPLMSRRPPRPILLNERRPRVARCCWPRTRRSCGN